jgi:hypothetical protein
MWKFLKVWFGSLLGLLICVRGEDNDDNGDDGDNGDSQDDQNNADGDSGNNAGKNRSGSIPRERFDKVNAEAQKLRALREAGLLVEDGEGNMRINPEAVKLMAKNKGKNDDDAEEDLSFKQDEVDAASWPLVQKLEKRFGKQEKALREESAKAAFHIQQLQAENAILREYPEFLQKSSPLRTKALDIMKNDPEFKQTYRGNPQAAFWAVKRAAQLLEGKTQEKPAPKPNRASFIVPKGDVGKAGSKNVDLTKLNKDQLDELERNEHERLKNLRLQKK